jgi:hypothetical protein
LQIDQGRSQIVVADGRFRIQLNSVAQLPYSFVILPHNEQSLSQHPMLCCTRWVF